MSIRGYKVIDIQTQDKPTFNISRQFDLVSSLGSFTERLTLDCTGLSTIYREDVEQEIDTTRLAIQILWAGHESAKDLEERLETLEDILFDMGENDHAEYLCF
jgi:hypothetical protein